MSAATETCEMACMPPHIHVTGCPNRRPPACPPSAVHDTITTWTDSTGKLLVHPGDLVLIGRQMETVEAIAYDPPEDEAVRVDLEGWGVTHCEAASNPVAVRRYVTGDAAKEPEPLPVSHDAVVTLMAASRRRDDTGPDRWQALRSEIQRDRDGYYEQACDHSEMAGHDAQEERAFGRVEECDDILAAMDRAEKEG